MTTTDIAKVRRIIKAAGLKLVKINVSTNVRKTHGMGGSYSTIMAQGFSLKNETEYRAKRHEPTGRVVVSYLLSSWHPDEAQAERDLTAAAAALRDAGCEVEAADTPNTLIVG